MGNKVYQMTLHTNYSGELYISHYCMADSHVLIWG
jgi:hypothetical protein